MSANNKNGELIIINHRSYEIVIYSLVLKEKSEDEYKKLITRGIYMNKDDDGIYDYVAILKRGKRDAFLKSIKEIINLESMQS
jgi:hypothetical protein